MTRCVLVPTRLHILHISVIIYSPIHSVCVLYAACGVCDVYYILRDVYYILRTPAGAVYPCAVCDVYLLRMQVICSVLMCAPAQVICSVLMCVQVIYGAVYSVALVIYRAGYIVAKVIWSAVRILRMSK